ncbi:hypothetical protein QYE76_029284 [Lolium multiflorum]|uniref:Uncharacterized protein n=1 Tax=Lolium multiflorum TaxID=4521 RepID=A0AAD8QMJ1_LOLMU|nr:hypothetical protein QYE76_029284 [Lolium multiflorum]
MVSNNKDKEPMEENIQDPEWKEVDESVKEEDEEEVEEDSRAYPRATIASIEVVENPFNAKKSARIRTGGRLPRHYLAPKTSSPGTHHPFRNLIYNNQIERTPKAALPSNWDIDRSNTAGRMKPERMEQFTQTEAYQLGNGGDMIFERDLFALTQFLRRPPPVFFGGQVNDQPGGQLQWIIMADLPGEAENPTERIQFSFRENTWVDGLARALQASLARLCGQNAMAIQEERFAHYARHNSLGVPLNLPSHPQLRHHVDHLDFMLSEVHLQLDDSRARINFTHLQLLQHAETIKVIAKERRTLRRENVKKDYTIHRLKASIATLKETIETRAELLRDLEGEGEGEDIQGDGYSYVSNDNDYEEDDDEDLAFHPNEDGHEHLTTGMDTTFPINVDGE